MGRILIRGEPGHDIIAALAPREGEPVIDKPGKGAFYATDLQLLLETRGISDLIVCGVTTEICVHTTGARGQRSRLSLHCAGRLLRVVLSRIPSRRPADDQGAGRDPRLGQQRGQRAGALDQRGPRLATDHQQAA
jgi:hypothetical protein